MSIALNRTSSGGDRQIERPIFDLHGVGCSPASIYNSAEFAAADRRFEPPPEDQSGSLSPSSSTSSIGKNSDESGGGGSGGGGDEEEVQSEYKGGPLDSLDALEEVLPVKKSISKFYCGKSKSFTSLSDAATIPSIQDITKPENEYTRKRKNLLAFNTYLDRNRHNLRPGIGGMSKRPTNSRSMLVLAASANGSETNSGDTSNSNSSPPGFTLPPLPPHARRPMHRELSLFPPDNKFSTLRSFSLFDLQGTAVAEASNGSGDESHDD
ncbi:protein OXIDATIVE STRESS 3 LIKE 1-like [Andrographis paniculata]|uniref:protein OXIDATIVE STRESS 3 LIKE 1-like n=1 Tax=Andrographis paniculata TaxID=175694 RepID=UPI0021E724A0|nr:protein OXIDATIVE STRESS 3 LIKE 1-like [Andrographis paniculata]